MEKPAFRHEGHRWLGGVRSLWLAVGGTLLFLGLAEGVARLGLALTARPVRNLRIAADAYPPEPWVAELYRENVESDRMRWEPYVYWRRQAYSGRQIQIDERGLRRTWRPPATSPFQATAAPPLRIFCFGGSTTWGTGVRDEHTIPSELGRFLAAAGVPAEVTNFGESGYVTTQEVIALLRQLQQGNVPDLAVFYFGMIDSYSTLQNHAAGLPLNEEHRVREFNLLLHARRLVREALRAAASRSALVRLSGLAGDSTGQPSTPLAPLSPEVVGETLRALDANLRTVQGMAASYGFRVNFFWEPSLFKKPHRTPYEVDRAASIDSSRASTLAVYAAAREDWARRSPDEFTYLGDFFADTAGPRFIDHAHTGETGNREIAASIGRQLLGHGRLRRHTPPP
jgi:hypothetical protein